jgi:hypothetical protein
MLRALIFLVFSLAFSPTLEAQSEADYSDQINQYYFQGQREVTVYGGRIDILTEKYAIEVERASKWKNAIGQALWYGQQTNKKPGIVLLVLSKAEYKYFQMLNSTLNYAGIAEKIKVWEYPRDFVAVLPEDGW